MERVGLVLIMALVLGPLGALELDRAELQDAAGTNVEFESYRGPEDRIDSAAAIRGIGVDLATQLARGAQRAEYAARYRLSRYIGDPADRRRAADVLEFLPSARVDRIDNVRRILVGYLEQAWGYRNADAELLARFITVYNAVHRGDLPFYRSRYRDAVITGLDADRVGLAISYREWPGRTQIVVPIQPDRPLGSLDAVDPGQLVDDAVVAELRRRVDLGIEDRKAIIAFIERVIAERSEQIAEERAELAEERAQVEERRAEIATALSEEPQTATQPPPTAPQQEPSPPVTPPQTPAAPGTTTATQPGAQPAEAAAVPQTATPDQTPQPAEAAAPVEPQDQRREQLEQEDRQLETRQEAIAQREAELDREQEEVEQLAAQITELYEETAEDQAAVQAGAAPTAGVRRPFILADQRGAFELALIDTGTGATVGSQTVPLAAREVAVMQGDLVVVHRTDGRLIRLDSTTLEIVAESSQRMVVGGRVVVAGSDLYAIVSEGAEAYIGRFGADLQLRARSADPVRPFTDILVVEQTIAVQAPNGSVRVLQRDSFR